MGVSYEHFEGDYEITGPTGEPRMGNMTEAEYDDHYRRAMEYRILTTGTVEIPEASYAELIWWREFHSRLVPGTDLPTIGSDLGPYNYRVSRAGFQDV